MDKMLKRDKQLFKNTQVSKSNNLEYEPNFGLVKPKSTYGPNFKNYTNRSISTSSRLNSTQNTFCKTHRSMSPSTIQNNTRKVNKNVKNFAKMLGRNEKKYNIFKDKQDTFCGSVQLIIINSYVQQVPP